MGGGVGYYLYISLIKNINSTNLGILRNLYSTEVVQVRIMIWYRTISFIWDLLLLYKYSILQNNIYSLLFYMTLTQGK